MTRASPRPEARSEGAQLPVGAVLTLRVGALLAVAVMLELLFRRVTVLPAASYHEPLLITELGRRLLAADAAAILAVVAGLGGIAVAILRRSAGPGWTDLEHGARLQWLVVIVSLLLAWVHATYEYNFYFDRWHGADRAVLLALVALVWWRPVALFPFLAVLLVIIGQFAQPIGGFSWASPILLMRVLFAVAAFWLLSARTPSVRSADLVFLLCCLVAAHYWASGIEKLRLGWLAVDRISYLLPATYASGWLAFLGPDTISNLTSALRRIDAPMRVATLLLEAGALFALVDRRFLRGLLKGWIALHAAIFLISGILFWEWMLLDLALLAFLFGRDSPAWPVFTPPHVVLSLILIGGGALWFRPVTLAWLDSPVSYAFRVEGTGASGRNYDLHPQFFAPYAYQFTLGDFRYLGSGSRLPVTWGATYERSVVEALSRATSASEIAAVEEALGTRHFDETRSEVFDDFIRRFIGHRNARPALDRWWLPFMAPPKLWTFRRGLGPDDDDPITRVIVVEVTSWFDGRNYHEIRAVPVRSIDVPPTTAAIAGRVRMTIGR